MIRYSVKKDFDSVTKNITLKYSVCKFDITHTAKFFLKKYHIMHRNSKVSADFWNGCIKAQSQFPNKVLLTEQKDMTCAWKSGNGCSVNNGNIYWYIC